MKLVDPSDADDKSRSAAADSTGLESGHTSHYFGRRSGRKKRRFPKLWAVVHAASHVCLSLACGVGPGPDDPKFASIAADAKRRLDALAAMLADAGFDGERHHEMLDALALLGVIPPERGRPRGDGRRGQRGGGFRNFWHQNWARAEALYGQRWQAETFFSMLKRHLNSFLRATKRWSRHREMCLKAITVNLMLLAHANAGR